MSRPWQAPLLPAALAVTAGIVLDRYFSVPLPMSLLLVVLGAIGWVCAPAGRHSPVPLLALSVCAAAFGAGHHHAWRHLRWPDDIRQAVGSDPQLVRLRGILLEEPQAAAPKGDLALRSFPLNITSRARARVTALQQGASWRAVSGRVLLILPGASLACRAGDEIEVLGSLTGPVPPGNPGEFDYSSYLKDTGVAAVLRVRHTADGLSTVRHVRQDFRSLGDVESLFAQLLGLIQRHAEDTIVRFISEPRHNVAKALLLGQESAMQQADWDRYQRTGVVHVLAVSGQHLVVLAYFLGLVARLLHVGKRRRAVVIALILLGYGLLTGGQPPVMRSVVMVCALVGALWLRRVVLAPNSFALAWLLVCICSPTAIFSAGCQLSFLAVAVLYWGVSALQRKETDPLDMALDSQRPLWLRMARSAGSHIGLSYLVTVAVWLAVTPLVASRFHLVCPVGLLVGPPVTLLTSCALLTGFLMLLFSWLPPLAQLLAWPTDWSLAACEWVVTAAEGWPGAYWFVADLPEWWLWCFYIVLLAALIVPWLRQRWLWVGLVLTGWLCLGLTLGLWQTVPDGLRCTFLDVGHGGCTVLETADGRTLLYDTGAIRGPEVTRRYIAPYLWSRGIRRIDEVFLSHADLDHFNGLPALTAHFAIGKVSCTPTFAARDSPAVGAALRALEKRGIPVRILRAGDRLTAGDVSIHVLHPPAVGPDGNENSRSLVLLVQHGDHALLLTGDLEKAGLTRVIGLPPVVVDVMMSPHHGSPTANTADLAKWAMPRVVISCQERKEPPEEPNEYEKLNANYLTTGEHGAVTIHSGLNGLVVETFRTKQRWTIR
jgi:competence protein ComEC